MYILYILTVCMCVRPHMSTAAYRRWSSWTGSSPAVGSSWCTQSALSSGTLLPRPHWRMNATERSCSPPPHVVLVSVRLLHFLQRTYNYYNMCIYILIVILIMCITWQHRAVLHGLRRFQMTVWESPPPSLDRAACLQHPYPQHRIACTTTAKKKKKEKY